MKRQSMRAFCAVPVLMMALCGRVAATEELPGILMIEVSGLKDTTGAVYVAIYDSDSTWLEDGAVLTRKVDIADALDGDLVRTEVELPMGEYAVSAFHDVDGNGELSTNF